MNYEFEAWALKNIPGVCLRREDGQYAYLFMRTAWSAYQFGRGTAPSLEPSRSDADAQAR